MTPDWDGVDACCEAAAETTCRVLKIVVFDDSDYEFARTISARYPKLPTYLQVGNPAPLRANGAPVWWLMAKDEGHGFAKRSNQDFQFIAMTMFWQKYLLQ